MPSALHHRYMVNRKPCPMAISESGRHLTICNLAVRRLGAMLEALHPTLANP